MPDLVPRRMKLEDKDSRIRIRTFFNLTNKKLEKLGPSDYEYITEVVLFLITGKRKEEINEPFFKEIVNYTKDNMGPLSIDFETDKYRIKNISIGSIKIGSLFATSFTEEELVKRSKSGANCCGYYPTMEKKDHIWLTLNDKQIMGQNISVNSLDIDNVHYGDYYFNRTTINKDRASFTKLEVVDDSNIKETIVRYNEKEEIERYQDFLMLTNIKDNEYLVTSLENSNDTKSKFGINQVSGVSPLIIK